MPTLLVSYITIGNKQCTPTLFDSYSTGESALKQCNFILTRHKKGHLAKVCHLKGAAGWQKTASADAKAHQSEEFLL